MQHQILLIGRCKKLVRMLGTALLVQTMLVSSASLAQVPDAEPSANGGYAVRLPVVMRGIPPDLIASGVVHTSESGTITHPNGARLDVPVGAVPTDVLGAEGEMLFTIESGSPATFGLPETPPQGWSYAGQVSKMGPEGFYFAAPIQATLPIPAGVDTREYQVRMFDYVPATDTWNDIGGQVSADGKELSADVMHLCNNVLLTLRWSGKGAGAIRFLAIYGYSFKLCIESFTVKYPEVDGSFRADNRHRSIVRRGASTCPPDGNIYWVLPQGTYVISVMVYRHDDDPQRTPHYLGYFTQAVDINQCHWDINAPGNTDYINAVTFPDLAQWTNPGVLNPAWPACMGLPSNSVGVGQLNVRLDWSANCDLDVWVRDPCDNLIFWNTRTQTCQGSAGVLDQDNWCVDFQFGRPENVFWAEDAPLGTYKVYVDYYQDCAGAGTVPYTVRWWVHGQAYSRRGTISPPATAGASGDEVLVATFTN